MSAKAVAGLPRQPSLRITVSKSAHTRRALENADHLIIVVPENPPAGLWQELPDGPRLKALAARNDKGALLASRLDNKASTGVTAGRLPASGNGKQSNRQTPFERLTFAGKLAAAACADNPASVALLIKGFEPNQADALLHALVLALAAHSFKLPSYKSGKDKPAALKNLLVLDTDKRIDMRRTLAEAEATNLTRWLTAQPPNKLDAKRYRALLQQLARDNGWRYEFLDEKQLHKAGAGAFLAVSQGNATRDAGIVRLRYRPAKATAKPAIALVGKGIIFDTGGTNLKPFKGMLDMHMDMAGSAAAVATLAALTELKAPFAVDCWLAITENRISAKAYKPRDIVTASNGVSIEVIHTDAEGRMALADTLALAGKQKPAAIVDFATLTGSCVAALTERYSGALSNRPELNATIIEAGQASGERVWPFPLDDDFDQEIESQVADVLQCAAAGGGDHIQAARFLKRFVPDDSAWVHVDLSAASRKGGLAQVPTEITGFGPRFALSLILDHFRTLTTAAGKR